MREAVTGTEGNFTITELKAGPYRIRGELQGFKAVEVMTSAYTFGRLTTNARVEDAEAQMSVFQRLTDEQRERAVTERENLVRRLAAVRF